MTTPSTEIRKLPLTRLAPSPFNVRRLRTEARIAEVAESLAADGQREPITVYPGTEKEAGTYLIVSGVTRYLAASALRWETLDAREDATLDPANTLALVKASRLHNDTHREPDRMQKIQFLATLDEAKGEILGERLDVPLRQFMEERAQDAQNSAFVSQHHDS
jgi:ParB-like chromosome segregation protein Spo0J